MPPELTGGKDHPQELPLPRVLVIEETNDGIFLYRIAEDGSFGGDTWHLNIGDAKLQAKSEYGDALGEWNQIPAEVADAIKYASSHIS